MSGEDEHVAASSAGKTPKLKLTFKLSEIRAATPPLPTSPPSSLEAPEGVTVSTLSGDASNSVIPKKRSLKGKVVPNTSQVLSNTTNGEFVAPHAPKKGRPRKDANRDAHSSHPGSSNDLPEGASGQRTGPSEATFRPPGSGNRVVFPEQVQFVKEMKKFRPRRWRLESMITLTLLAGKTLLLPGWVHEEKAIAYGAPQTASPRAQSLPTTFVCTYEGCHKIFDVKDKWRRHQNAHKKKSKKAAALLMGGASSTSTRPAGSLQLKLNMGVIKAAAASRASHSSKSPSSSPRQSDPSVSPLATSMTSNVAGREHADADADIEIEGESIVVSNE